MTVCRLVSALALALALGGARAHAEADVPVAHVVSVSGSVEVASLGKPGWRPAHAGLALSAGASLRTGDAGRAEVALASGTVRVYENSLLRVPGAEDGIERVRLRKGAGLFDVKLPKGSQFRVETPEAVAAVKGTRFLIEAARGAMSTGVFEGIVELRKLGAGAAPPVLVREGFGATLGDDAFELMVLDRADPWHEWQNGAPAPGLISPPASAAEDDGGDAGNPAAAARKAARAAALEATDAVLDSDRELRTDGPKREESASANQDDVFESGSLRESAIERDVERPEKIERIEPIEIDVIDSVTGLPGSSGPSSPNSGGSDDDDDDD